jgi:hypothetical protein
MNVPFHIVVEPQEYLQYARVINSKKIIVTPFSNLNQGSIPVRNFVWDLAKQAKVKRYWILDDNIKWFYRLNNNVKVPVNSGTIFKVAEDFVDRYTNIALAGFQYEYFVPRKAKVQPISLNNRIYSCILIQTDIPYQWRGKYNEDTDLSIRVLKDGWCTVLFNAFLCGKVPTLSLKGGNASIYNQTKSRKEFAESLKKQHPDIVEIIWRYNRWHHKVDYSSFRDNLLNPINGLKVPSGINNYGMELIKFNESKSIYSTYEKD